jgi:hypothetical protein
MAGLLAVVERAAASNLLLAEDYLARQAALAAEPSTPAPPTAGGQL